MSKLFFILRRLRIKYKGTLILFGKMDLGGAHYSVSLDKDISKGVRFY